MIAERTSAGARSLRLPSLIGITALIVGMAAACSSAASSSTSSPAASSSGGSASSQHKVYNVTFLSLGSWNSFHFTLTCDVQADATKSGVLNVKTIEVPESQWTVQGMTSLLETAAASHPQEIVTPAPSDTAMDATFETLKSDGIKLVLFDSIITNQSIADSQVTTNVYETGEEGAQLMAKATGGKGKILILDLEPGITSTNERTDGFIAEVKAKYPGMTVLPVQYDDLIGAKDAQIVTATLARYPDLAGIYSTYDDATIGAMPALISAGKAGKIAFISNDSDPILVKYLQEGYIQALTPHNVPVFAQDLVNQMIDALQGKSVSPPTTEIPSEVVTKSNLDTPAAQAALYRSTC